jgi:hypothetical protein
MHLSKSAVLQRADQMSKQKFPKIEIRQREGSKGIMTGGNTEVLVDGKKLTTATKVSFEVAASGIARVNVELLGEIAITGRIGKYSKVPSKIQTQ